MSEPTTGALTREMFERAVDVYLALGDRIAKSQAREVLFKHDAALRQALAQSEQAAYDVAGTIDQLKERIAQQAQEIAATNRQLAKEDAARITLEQEVERLKMEVNNRREEVDKLVLENTHTYAVVIPDIEQQLAAMTRERDDERSKKNDAVIELYRRLDTKDAELAASQARCRVLEKGFSDQTAIRERHEAGFTETIAQLQATLAAREEQIRQLGVANKYFAISEERLAKERDAAVQEAGRLREALDEFFHYGYDRQKCDKALKGAQHASGSSGGSANHGAGSALNEV